jgi:two-component system response regulator QseB
MRLLLVEDDEMFGESLQGGIKNEGYIVDWVKNADEAFFAIATYTYDLILLDLCLPDYSGLELLKKIRDLGNRIPIIITTAKDTIEDRIIGLDAGADDYLIKPFSLNELFARFRAIFRRLNGRADFLIEYDGLTLNPKTFEAVLNDEIYQLSNKEFAILIALIEHPGVPLSKSQLEEKLYGWDDLTQSNTVEVFIHGLRKKIGSKWIKNIRGLGYFVPKMSSDLM